MGGWVGGWVGSLSLPLVALVVEVAIGHQVLLEAAAPAVRGQLPELAFALLAALLLVPLVVVHGGGVCGERKGGYCRGPLAALVDVGRGGSPRGHGHKQAAPARRRRGGADRVPVDAVGGWVSVCVVPVVVCVEGCASAQDDLPSPSSFASPEHTTPTPLWHGQRRHRPADTSFMLVACAWGSWAGGGDGWKGVWMLRWIRGKDEGRACSNHRHGHRATVTASGTSFCPPKAQENDTVGTPTKRRTRNRRNICIRIDWLLLWCMFGRAKDK